MVIEAHLRGWTADALVRQAAFKGVREDKPPQEVVREVPAVSQWKIQQLDQSHRHPRSRPRPQKR